jgi:hypothetical protein
MKRNLKYCHHLTGQPYPDLSIDHCPDVRRYVPVDPGHHTYGHQRENPYPHGKLKTRHSRQTSKNPQKDQRHPDRAISTLFSWKSWQEWL